MCTSSCSADLSKINDNKVKGYLGYLRLFKLSLIFKNGYLKAFLLKG